MVSLPLPGPHRAGGLRHDLDQAAPAGRHGASAMIFGARHSDTPDRGWYYVPWWRTVILEDGRCARRHRVFRVWNPGNWAGGQRWMYYETEAEAPPAQALQTVPAVTEAKGAQ